MRTFLLSLLLTGALAFSSGLTAAPLGVAGAADARRVMGQEVSPVLVQKRNLRRFPAAGSREIYSGNGILRDRFRRGVRTSGNRGRGEIGPGQAVISAQSYLPGTVLGVRRNGAVYNVKIKAGNRVRIITVSAATGQVIR